VLTVTVTKMSGGVVELFNPDTGKITYKAKAETAYLNLEGFGGIVKFNKKGSKATIVGTVALTEDCDIIKQDSPTYKSALLESLKAQKSFLENKKTQIEEEISQISRKLEEIT